MNTALRERSGTIRAALGIALAALIALAMLASGAHAAEPTGVTGPGAEPTSTVGAAAKKKKKRSASSGKPRVLIGAAGSYRYHGKRYVLPRTLVEIKGEINADLNDQIITLVIKKNGHTVKTDKVRTVSRGGKTTFSAKFRTGKKGKYIVTAELSHEQQQIADAGNGASITVVRTNIHRGSKGVAVKLFQSKLKALKYVTPVNGRFDAATGRAFMAFRKNNYMARTEGAGYKVARKLAEGKGGFKLRYPKAGRHVEVSIKKQVMAFADNGKVQRIYHVSTGAPSTPTVRGTYHVYMKDGGTNAKGMVKSSYFIRGYAIHGYASVPPYNASHGCVRVPVPNAASIFAWVHMGTRIDTYY